MAPIDQTQFDAAVAGGLDPEVLKKLDPEYIAYYLSTLQHYTPTHEIPIEQIRANPAKYAAPWHYNSKDEPRTESLEATSADGHKIPVRVYHPDPEKFGLGPHGVHINYHGGGFVFGSLDADSRFCMSIREQVGLTVVDVNYRHCPETSFGKNIEDAWAALNWVINESRVLNTKPDSVSLGGISAGGFFCFVLQHMARDAGIPLRLIVPAVGVTLDVCSYKSVDDSPFESFREFSKAPQLNWARISYFQQYVFPEGKDAEIRSKYPDWWLAPLRAPNFSNLCDAFIITAECDPVRDEAEAYAMKAVAAGNKVTLKRYLGVPHPWMHMTDNLEQARQYDRDFFSALRTAHELRC